MDFNVSVKFCEASWLCLKLVKLYFILAGDQKIEGLKKAAGSKLPIGVPN